ncbi:MAG TPA: ABC transporter substrate-binding protein [Gaiellaceae bacterium]|nr:ABC transporter substrate-binding protein [Gaiellaceae bacterium]
MTRPKMLVGAAGLAAAATAALLVVALGGTASAQRTAAKPIIIGAAVDLTNAMKPFDSAALRAAQIEAAKTKVNGRPFKVVVCNTQLDKDKTKACADQLIAQGAVALLVTCDVEYAAPATQEAINAGRLALGSCIGTDQQGPKRFGSKGRLAFSFGNVAQDEGAAMAEYAYKVKHWKKAITVTDNLLVYFQTVMRAFTARYTHLGGKIVRAESFTNSAFGGPNQVPALVNRLRNTNGAQVIATTTTFGDWPQIMQGVRSLGVKTPIMNSWAGDGTNWYPQNPKVTKYWYVTFASIFGDDPNPAVRRLFNTIKRQVGTPATGSFVTGATVIDALATAIRRAHGSTKGIVLAKQFEHFHGLKTISGKISFSKQYHTVFGRSYRVIEVENNKGKYVGTIRAGTPANVHD